MAGGAKRRKTAKRAPVSTSRTAEKRPATTRGTTKSSPATAKQRPATRKAAGPAPQEERQRAPRRRTPDDTARRLAAQLAVVDSVQKALAGGLGLQRVYGTVVDRLRDIFRGANVGIRIYDPQTGLEHFPYTYYNGRKYSAIPPQPLAEQGFGAHVIRTRRTLVIDEDLEQESRRYGSRMLVDDAPFPKTQVMVPLVVGNQARGMLVLMDAQREHAFTKSDVQLLETVASSLSVALENARLFKETQRLLKETEQRNAELAVINRVQEGLAAKLEFQSVIDLVGDKVAEIFGTKGMTIALYDASTNLLTMPYYLEHGERFPVAPSQMRGGLTAHVIRTRRPLLINRDLHTRGIELGSTLVGDAGTPPVDGSYLGVPILKGEEARGVIALYADKTDAFSDTDIHLLTTLSNAMSVALENARLFDETQRRSREMTALAEVGRDISATLDLATVMDRIARHARTLLHADNSAIFLPEAGGQTYRAIVAHGTVAEAIKAAEIESGAGIIGSLLAAGKAEFINDTGVDPRTVQIPGTDRATDERLMVAPLLAGTAVRGAMAVWRTGGRPFDDTELEFLTGLSRQATVAIENARLFDETRQSLERQTATAEVLRVISASMADPKPVFDKILDSCARLFGTSDLSACLVDGGMLRIGAYRGGFADEVEHAFPRPLAGTISEMAIRQGSVLHRASVLAAQDLPEYIHEVARRVGDFSVANAPMRHRHHRHRVPAAAAVFGDRTRAAQDLRRPGGHRDPECAALQRDARSARAANGDLRHPARDQRVANGCQAGARRRGRTRRPALPRRRQPSVAHHRWAVARDDDLRRDLPVQSRRGSAAAHQDVDRRPRRARTPVRPRRGRAAPHRWRVPGHP
jgi:GAF domain-containing protein